MTRVHAAFSLGTVFGLAVTPQLVARLGWPAALRAFGAAGLAWAVTSHSLDGLARGNLRHWF
jgi:hypothetical protein